MQVENLLKSSASKGIRLWAEKDKLRYRAPKEVATPALLTQLKEYKADILDFLQQKGSYAPLSYGQQALWFIYQSEPDSVAYNIPVPLRLRVANLNVARLKDNLQALVNRHTMLRTAFTHYEGKPLQHILSHHLLDWEDVDTSGWSEKKLIEQIKQRYHNAFDLENSAVFRASLFHSPDQEYPVLFLCVHHIVCDDWSTQVMLDELRCLYEGEELTQSPSYLDYIDWQAALLSEKGEKLADYWQKQLGGELPQLKLPTDYPRPAVLRLRGASQSFTLNPKLSQQLKALARNEGVTLYNLLLAAFQVLLYRYTGQDDILVGSPTSASRSEADFAATVGYFINQIVLRADLSNNPSFKTFVRQVRKTVLGSLEHQDYPFPLLVKQLKPTRDPSRSPLFQTFFVFQNMRFNAKESDTTATPFFDVIDIGQMEGQFDLILVMEEQEAGTEDMPLVGTFKYNTDLFKESSIIQLMQHFQILLEGIVENPETPVAMLPILSETEQNKMLVTWNETQQPYSKHHCIHQLFEDIVKQSPDATAVVFSSSTANGEDSYSSLSYQELNTRSNQLAHHLIEIGVCQERLVGLLLDRSIDMVVGLLAILKAGGVYVPLDPKYPQERLHFMLENAEIKTLLTRPDLADTVNTDDIELVYLDQYQQQSQQNPNSDVHPDNLAYIIYTSGSTGQPKGVMIAHHGVCNLAEAQIRAFGVNAESRVLQFASLNFDASISEIMMALCSGARLHLASSDDLLPGPTLERLLQHHLISHVTLTPSALAVLSTDKLPALQSLIVAGEPCSADLVNRWSKNRRFFNAYGPTESTVCATIMECATNEAPPIGKAMANTQIYIVDQYLQPVPIGVSGELHIASVGLARGYLNRPNLTQEKFIHVPFTSSKVYKTGDLARYLPDGNIEFLGRIDNQVKVRGYRIELGEIEAQLKQHPDIQNAVVIVRGSGASKQLFAYFVNNSEIKAEKIRHYLADKLPEYMIPAAFISLKEMPITPNGKVDHRALPEPDTAELSTATFVAPNQLIEQQLVDIWEFVLNVRPIGIQDDFFELGGHSLLAIRLLSHIKKTLGKTISLGTLLQSTTIAQLAQTLKQEKAIETRSSLVQIQTNGEYPPLFCIHPIGGNVLCYRDLAQALGNNQPLYGLQAQGLENEQLRLTQVTAMATEYIQAIKTLQPSGPYYLAGWSFGGVIAFEMAQQWQTQGESVALLALIDSYPYSHEQGSRTLDESALLSYFMNDLSKGEGNLSAFKANTEQNINEQLETILKKSIAANLLPSDLDLQHLKNLWQLFKANYQAALNYTPQPYSKNIVLFQSDEAEQENNNNWQSLAKGKLEKYPLQGNHYTLMTPPHVALLANHLKSYLHG